MNIKEINKLPWPENLLRLILSNSGYEEWKTRIPPDFEESFQFILEETLTERETYILYSFYRDRMRMRDIGERYGIQAERCRQIREKAIRRIRHPSRYRYLKYGMAEVEKQNMEPPKDIPIMQQTIDELDLSVRAFNCLKRANVQTIEDLTRLSTLDLMLIRNMGRQAIAEVERKLKDRGLALRPEDK